MERNIILLVEDNPDDIVLTQRAFKKSKVLNKVVRCDLGSSQPGGWYIT